jgi:hypothetical protein
MERSTRVQPWFTLSIAQGTTLQVGGLVGAAALARIAARHPAHGGGWLIASRVLAYFCDHAVAHWSVGRLVGIRFTAYGVHGTSHPQVYPPGIRAIFTHLPLLSARTDPESLRAAAPTARAAMYAAGTVSTAVVSLVIPLYGLRHGVQHARGVLIGSSLGMGAILLSEALRPGGDLQRAWRTLRTQR